MVSRSSAGTAPGEAVVKLGLSGTELMMGERVHALCTGRLYLVMIVSCRRHAWHLEPGKFDFWIMHLPCQQSPCSGAFLAGGTQKNMALQGVSKK
jgi:hypothetical protein